MKNIYSKYTKYISNEIFLVICKLIIGNINVDYLIVEIGCDTMFLLLMMTVLVSYASNARGGYDCIDRCICMEKDGLLVADCISKNFTDIPVPKGYVVHVLLLNFNQINQLRKDAFIMYNSLMEVNLSGNRMQMIEEGSFNGLGRSNLLRLDLSLNSLREIPQTEMMRVSHSLTQLSLSYNAHRRFPNYLRDMNKLTHFDISQNTITSLPTNPFPPSLVNLNLGFTSVRSFKATHFDKMNRLVCLVMSDNQASGNVHFESGIFDNLISLKYLDLSRCFCRRLTPRYFVKLRNLTTLLLRSSYINTMPIFYDATIHPPTTSSFLMTSTIASNNRTDEAATPQQANANWFNPKLEHIDMSHNRKLSVEPRRGNLYIFPPSLVSLDLSYTSTRSVSSTMFSNLNKLETLKICFSRVGMTSNEAFLGLTSLLDLDLSGNQFVSQPALPSSLHVVNMTSSKLINLTRVGVINLKNLVKADWSDGSIRRVEAGVFINMSHLVELNLSSNYLQNIEERTFMIGPQTSTSSLQILDLSNNDVSLIDGSAFKSLDQLNHLYLQDNQIQEVNELTLNGLVNLKTLNLGRNRLIDISPNSLRDLSLLEELHLENNELEIIYSNLFASSVNLKTLSLSDNHLLEIHHQNFPSLLHLDLNRNNISSLPVADAPRLTRLFASENDLQELTSSVLSLLPNLELLDIHYNDELSQFNYTVFQYNSHLMELNMGNCGIHKFVDQLCPSLQVLLIGENRISDMTEPIATFLPVIQQIDLSFNNIASIRPSVFNNSKTLLSVDLNGNNFNCDCELVSFVQWMLDQYEHDKVDVVGANSYMCENPPSEFAHPVIIVVEELDCNKPPNPHGADVASFTIEIILGGITLVVVIVAVVIACYCRRRTPETHTSSLTSLDDASASRSPRLCCEWFIVRYDGGLGRSRVMSDDEGRDLMIASPLPTPTDADCPDML